MSEIKMSDTVCGQEAAKPPLGVAVPDVSCCQVTKAMCCKPRVENVFWVYCARPILVTFAVLAALGCLYLYLVPLTNIVGKGLFADYVRGCYGTAPCPLALTFVRRCATPTLAFGALAAALEPMVKPLTPMGPTYRAAFSSFALSSLPSGSACCLCFLPFLVAARDDSSKLRVNPFCVLVVTVVVIMIAALSQAMTIGSRTV